MFLGIKAVLLALFRRSSPAAPQSTDLLDILSDPSSKRDALIMRDYLDYRNPGSTVANARAFTRYVFKKRERETRRLCEAKKPKSVPTNPPLGSVGAGKGPVNVRGDLTPREGRPEDCARAESARRSRKSRTVLHENRTDSRAQLAQEAANGRGV
ncbi:unnamed protein product [Peniophora sp. CBMAI 1063]|nr:unnamed protein product [Peniophora sp. CBMAI 1063]